MSKVDFNFNGGSTIIQCNENDSMDSICSKFSDKIQIDKNKLIFSYNGKGGNEFNKSLSFSEMANLEDKIKNKMSVLVFTNEGNNKSNNIIKSKVVICPECKEISKLNIKNYKVTISNCKNNHIKENLSLSEFEDSQKIDLSQILCHECKKSKAETFQKKFNYCMNCNINLCPICENKHDENHSIILYDDINYICKKHNDNFAQYCETCKINICMECEEEHENHKKIYFGKILTNQKELQNNLEQLQQLFQKFNKDFESILQIITCVKNNFELYYKIKKDISDNNKNKKNKNYELLMNLKESNNCADFIEDIKKIIDQNTYKNKFMGILGIYNKIKNTNFANLDSEMSDLKKKYDDLLLENKILNSEKDKLESKCDTLENEKLDLEAENEELNSKLSELEDEIEKLNKEISKLKLTPIKRKSFSVDPEYEKYKKQSELIGKTFDLGIDQKTRVCTKYNLGNKCLIMHLIQSNFITSEKVVKVMLDVDRNDFAPSNPYADRPQYIGYNVTISAPHMHAFALEYLSDYCTEGAKILDVGSGSGFLTVALSKMTNDSGTVVGIDHIPELYEFGMKNIKKNHSELIKKGKIILVIGDGRKGYKEKGPYKAIHVGACSEKEPQELIDQLDYNGRMFIPVGKKGETQNICIYDKDAHGKVTCKSILSVCYGMLTDVESQLNQ